MRLDGFWKFKLDPDNTGEKNEWYKTFPADCEKMYVPSCWNNELGKYDYEGKAWYATEFYHSAGDLLIHFGAVSTYAKVYIDGNYISEHYGGFTSFDVSLPSFPCGNHTLTVMVESLYNNTDTIPLAKVDWYHYGGITRSVEVMSKPAFWIKDVKVSYNLDESLSNADVTLNIFAYGKSEKEYTLYINDEFIKHIRISEKENAVKLNINNVKLWDTDSPYLYTFKLQSEDDIKSVRTGFRKISVHNGRLALNNKPLFIKGINRHEEHPDWGFSFPEKLIKKDIDILFDMNVNFVRGSHYPNSHKFLDYCDETGMMFWSEIPMWGIPEEVMANPVFIERAKTMMAEMTDQYYNHPSIVVWGLHNECATDTQAGYNLTKELHSIAKTCGGNRLITYATFHSLTDISLEFCDFISENIYVGWYIKSLKDWADYLTQIDNYHKTLGLSHIPVVMSEFGAAGVYGECNFESPKWSENYQSHYIKTSIEEFLKRENIAGTFIWQFADIRVCPEVVMNRARGFNNKGVLNEYRKPKMAYFTAKEIYSKIK